MQSIASHLFSRRDDEPEIPATPPTSMRGPYLQLSWAYIYWCTGMLIWAFLCVGYFIVTRQTVEMIIGVCLGVLLMAMIYFPAALFGRETWYKRLGWVTILTALFAIMFIYPMIVVTVGIARRISEGRYSTWPHFNDLWHLILSVMTVVLSVWTIYIAVRSARLVKRLQRGDYTD